MSLLSFEFIGFIASAWLLFAVLPKQHRSSFLLIVSFVYYSYFSVAYLLLILASSSADFFASRFISKSTSSSSRKFALLAAISWNLSILGFFKYGTWLIWLQSAALGRIGIHLPLPSLLDILLPLGISFYTFEAISYMIDVYRGEAPAKSWLHYNLYIMWFPHLVSGPIVRFKNLRQQFEQGINLPTADKLKQACELILVGCAAKFILADSAGLIGDPIFQRPSLYYPPEILGGMLAYLAQLYFDFWGYSQIARGVSLLFNISLPPNFNFPGTASSISDFWTRWHISLSQWMHDYVFLPAGGRSRILWRTLRALAITMMLVGIWHGPGITYVIFGLYITLQVVVYHLYRSNRRKLLGAQERVTINKPAYRIFSWILTQASIVIATAILRSQKLAWLKALFLALVGIHNPFLIRALEPTCLLYGLLFFGAYALAAFGSSIREIFWKRCGYFVRVQAYAYAIILCCIFASETPKQFIYFKF